MPSTVLGEALGLRSALALAIRAPQPQAAPGAAASQVAKTKPPPPSEAASTNGGPAASAEDAAPQLAAAATAARLVSRFASDMLELPCTGL